jgi:D-alanyl-D-alanine carboxypeptidase
VTLDRRTLIALPAAGLLVACGPRPARSSTAPAGSVQRIVDESGAPALGGLVVTADGTPFLEVAGLRRKDGADRVTAQDKWHLGSNTKAMTAALYGKLVEGGQAKWGATLGELFPDLTRDPAWAATTIEAVMSHTAGLSDKGLLGMTWLIAAQADKRPLPEQRAAVVAKALAAPPNGKPGVFEYGNINFIVAGAAIERLTGGDWETAMTERLFKPLGMTGAGFGAPRGDQPWGHRSGPMGIGGLRAVDPAGMADNPAAMGPAGTVHAPLADYAKFLRLFLTGGGDYLKPETIAHLTTPAAGADYALGWGVAVGKPWARGPRLGHEGSNTMWHATALVAPARGVALVSVSNAYPSGPVRAGATLIDQMQTKFAPA